jgi:type IV pilus assembly protein PilV
MTQHSRERGYTLVELMMAITVFAIGVVGVIAMQRVTAASNQHARTMATATHIAQSWIDELNADAVQWNHPSATNGMSDIADTIWLSSATTANKEWIIPSYSSQREFGPAFDALGNVVNPGTNPKYAKYCTHIRLSWLYPPTAGVRGNGLMRAEVRVFWLRSEENSLENRQVCDAALKPELVGAATDRYHFIYKVAAIRQNNPT